MSLCFDKKQHRMKRRNMASPTMPLKAETHGLRSGSLAMHHRFAQPKAGSRLSFLGLVLGAHALLVAAILTHQTILPKIMEMPLMVDLIEAKPLPVAPAPGPKADAPLNNPSPAPPKPKPRPQPQKKAAPPPKPQPVLETTTSTEPASDNAPTAPAEETKAPPVTEGGGSGVGTGAASGDGGLAQARFDADYLHNPAPPYPPMSRRLGEEGKVILRVRVSAGGMAEQVEIRTSSGSARLDESARRTVRAWKFIPAKRGGIPVESWVLVPIHFRLEQ